MQITYSDYTVHGSMNSLFDRIINQGINMLICSISNDEGILQEVIE